MILAFSVGLASLLIACLVVRAVVAEYDCSAKEDGWYHDPEFCHIYWRCTHGSAEEFECASGTAWDHHANRCNWLEQVDCTRAEPTTPKTSSEEDEEETSEIVPTKLKKRKTAADHEDDDSRERQRSTASMPACLPTCLLA